MDAVPALIVVVLAMAVVVAWMAYEVRALHATIAPVAGSNIVRGLTAL